MCWLKLRAEFMDLQRILARDYNLLFLATYKHQNHTIQTRKKQTVVKSKLKKESKEKGIISHCYPGWSLLNKNNQNNP